MTHIASSYAPQRTSVVEQLQIRGNVSYQLRRWRAEGSAAPEAPPLLLLHGWMDIGASFQRCVDKLNSGREIVAIDWRGFGGSRYAQSEDSYWFYDYYADLDAIIDYVSPSTSIDLLGHSMGANVAMIYAGTCPERIRRLINVEGFGLAQTQPDEAPARLAKWLAELKKPVSLRTFEHIQEVVANLVKRSPHIEHDFALWLAQHWTERKEDGRWHVCADAVHKRVNPILYRCDEALASWENIAAPTLWVEGDQADQSMFRGERYTRQEFEARLSKVKLLEQCRISDCGHMVHLDQPDQLARAIEQFLSK